MQKISLKYLFTALLAGLLASTAVQADTFPDRPMRMVVPFPPGGTTDVLVRMLQKQVSEASGQPLVVDNRPGGASVIGTSTVARSAPDGYTVVASDLSMLVNPSLIKDMPYDTVKDFRGVTMLARAPLLLLVNPDVPAKTLEELIALAKAKPGTINFSSGGYGTSTHMAGEMFRRAAGIDIVHVPYPGSPPAMTALVAGQVQIYFGGPTTALSFIQSGKMRALAITGDTPSPLLPDVPTLASRGIKGVNADSYWGIYAPAGTPDDVVAKLNKYYTDALRDPELVQRAKDLGLELIGNDPAAHTAQMRQMIQDWKDFVTQAGIKLE